MSQVRMEMLGQLCTQVRGIAYGKDEIYESPVEDTVPLLRATNILETGELDLDNVLHVNGNRVSQKQLLKKGDVLISASTGSKSAIGKPARVRANGEVTFGAFCKALRPNTKVVDADYFWFLFCRPEYRSHISNVVGGANINNIRNEHIDEMLVPLPPLETQKHIARVLEHADQLRKQAQQMESELNQLAQSLFLEMFGDPVTNPKKWKTATLGSLVEVTSGATPSKSNKQFWLGAFPWVSPKDMKSIEICDAIDHINERVFAETNLKRIDQGSILIVVRGMILAHTVPIAITTASVAINQDIKALRVVDENVVDPRYLLACLIAMHDKLLGVVSTAAHGTKRIETTDLSTLTIPIPPMQLQRDYFKAVFMLRKQVEASADTRRHFENLFQVLMQRAFKGELTSPGSKAA